MTEDRRDSTRAATRLAFGALLLAVLGLIVFLRPGHEAPGEVASPAPSATGAPLTAQPAPAPSESTFCDQYRLMAGAQSQYVVHPDARAAELLREAAESLLATGIPDSMSILAQGGFFIELSGVYGSIGLALDPQSMPGAAEASRADGASTAFASYLARSCPVT
jgi:hypothetical protein